MKKKKIAVLVGSLRKASLNLKVAKQLMRLAPDTLELEQVNIGNLPMYNEDLEANTPESWVAFRNTIQDADGVLFVTPEYNRTTSPAIKNAIDVASRPWGKNVWNEKPGAVMSVSMSALGGFGANHAIRQAAACLNIPMMQQPEAYIGNAHTLFDENNNLTSTETETFLKNFMVAYEQWVNRFSVA
ncbi:MAG: NAD(P)H-dependent oxidoreductase [Ferruginibacter sp.]|nr:NAD(P)H-dependent oxidoreductase [Ferruginibacter sp.]